MRYDSAKQDCDNRGCAKVFADFEASCGTTVAVLNCTIERLYREIATGSQVFETYYSLDRLRLRFDAPDDPDWQIRRPQAEAELLGSDRNKDQLHYGALSLDGRGVASYGPCNVELKELMIAHRASCFEGNSALIYHNQRSYEDVLRSDWSDRAKLCAAKLGPKLTASTKTSQFSKLLLKNAKSKLDDDFVEVHIFGSITAQTFERVTFNTPTPSDPLPKAYVKAVKEKLLKNGVQVTP